MDDKDLEKIINQLQSASSNNERFNILKQNGLWNGKEEICERCKSAHKFENLNMCVVVDWCRWDLSYKWFRKERQPQNSSDCKNFLDDECIKYVETLDKDNHDKCEHCLHFCKKEGVIK